MRDKLPSQRVIEAVEAGQNFGALLSRVAHGDEQVVVEEAGVAVAAIIGMGEYEHYRRLLAREQHRDLGRKLGQAAREAQLTEEQLIAELEDDRIAIYDEMYRSRSGA